MTKIHNPHDRYFRTLMAKPEVAQEFFVKHLPDKIKSIIDLKSLQLQHNSYVDDGLHEQVVDLLYSADFSGLLGYIYVLVEHQSTPEKLMPFRMLKYMVAIMEDHLEKTGGNTLPIIYPIIMYSGAQPYNYSTDLFDLFENKELALEILWQPYQLADISKASGKEFDEFLWYGTLAKAMKYIHKYRKDITLLIEQMMPELQKIENLGKISYIITTVKYFCEVGEISNQDKFRDVIKRGLTKTGDEIMSFAEQMRSEGRSEGYGKGLMVGIEQGLEQGINRGKTEAMVDVAIKMLQQNLDPKIVILTTGLSLARILELKKEIELRRN